ncbi:hypothetical protein C1T31_07165 [Hanstruepera neustonica]|uniref:Sulfotransferase n=1 Tax=Hanstruepera neustonica TaxID=1445657 RepID=A0A2K1DZ37_9FLAO|nr:sulfotransferase [Hanstruepera neustonica]PNQ73292.1 hypothetical protein C1T31_07165 [Hanstruepera neustonica]
MIYQNLFIIGSPRSGTSMFRMMLSSHESIVVPPECGFIQWWYEKYKDWNKSSSQSERMLNDFLTDLKTSKKIETWGLDFKALKLLIIEESPVSYSQLMNMVILQYAFQNGKKPSVLGDKNNYYIDYLRFLKQTYPNAKFLVIIRDPRDVVCSYLNVNSLQTSSEYKPKFPNTIKEMSLDWYSKNMKIAEFLESINPSTYKIVKYEDLLSQPELELEKCTNLLDLEFEYSMMDFYKNNMEPSELLDWKKKTNQQLDKNNTQKYLKQLTQSEIEEIVSVSGELMEKFGYE